jgi:hypothetical protein
MDRHDNAVVAALRPAVFDREPPASAQCIKQRRQRSNPSSTLDAATGSELQRLQRPIKVHESEALILPRPIRSPACRTLLHAAMVGAARGQH